jgi:hypothetical protein
MSVPFEITVFTKTGGPLTKRISLAPDGSIKSDGSQCKMTRGRARRCTMGSMQGLADLINAATPYEALATGPLRPDLPTEVEVVTKLRLGNDNHSGVIARSQDHLGYRPGELAVVLLDFDNKGMPPVIAKRIEELGGFWNALISIVPELARTARVERASTSAGLYNSRTGEKYPGSGGRHVYLLIKDGADAERFLKILHEHCWLHSLAWIIIGRAGQSLERSIVDRVCGTPERLAFEGQAVLVFPLAQDAEARRAVAFAGDALDTKDACKALTFSELTKLHDLRTGEKRRLAGASTKAREAFINEQAMALSERTGAKLSQARKTIERQCDGVLLPDVVLPFDDEDLAGKTVADVLADPDLFENETLADPIEGVEYGRCKAKIMRRTDGSLWIHSFAHGNASYELKIDFASAKEAIEKTTAENAAETLQRLVRDGDLGADEVEILRNLAHKISGVGKRTLDRKLKEIQRSSPDSQPHVDLIRAFNAQYAVVSEAGKAMVYERVLDPMLKRYVITRSRFDDFRKFYQNQSVEVRGADGSLKHKSAGDFWLDHPLRRQYLGGVVFDPTNKVGSDYWNLWSSFGVDPRPGDWGLMQDHIYKVICAGIDEHYEFLLNTAARMFQYPHLPAEIAVVLRGDKGAGKGVLGVHLVKAWGQHGAHIGNSKHLVGNFNNHLRDCVMLFADEAFFAGDKQHEGVLKMLITEPTLPIEGKYMDVIFVRNMLHIYMSSNSEWVVPASHDERRYFVLDVIDTHIGDRPYFNALYKQMQEGGLAAMIYDLRHRDISDFDPRDVPKTEALAEQHRRSLDSLDRWWLTVLERGFVWRSRFGMDVFSTWHEFCATELLEQSYLQWCAETRVSRPEPRVALGVRMSQMYSQGRPRGAQIIGELNTWPPNLYKDKLVVRSLNRPPGYTLNSLDEARARFADIRGVTGDWTTPIDMFSSAAAR